MILEIQGGESDDFSSQGELHKEDCMAEVHVILRIISIECIIYNSLFRE